MIKNKKILTWETSLSEGNKTEPKHRLYKRKTSTAETESKKQIPKDRKQNPQTPLWYLKNQKIMSEVLVHWGWEKLRKARVREGKQDDFFLSNFITKKVRQKPILAFVFIFCILFVSRHEQIASIQLQKQMCCRRMIAYKAVNNQKTRILKAIKIKQLSHRLKWVCFHYT